MPRAPRPSCSSPSYHLPHLAAGDALSFLDRPHNAIFNLAPFGIPFKLANLGFSR